MVARSRRTTTSLGLMKTCMKLGVSFFDYFGDRLGIPGEAPIVWLPNLIGQAAM